MVAVAVVEEGRKMMLLMQTVSNVAEHVCARMFVALRFATNMRSVVTVMMRGAPVDAWACGNVVGKPNNSRIKRPSHASKHECRVKIVTVVATVRRQIQVQSRWIFN